LTVAAQIVSRMSNLADVIWLVKPRKEGPKSFEPAEQPFDLITPFV